MKEDTFCQTRVIFKKNPFLLCKIVKQSQHLSNKYINDKTTIEITQLPYEWSKAQLCSNKEDQIFTWSDVSLFTVSAICGVARPNLIRCSER